MLWAAPCTAVGLLCGAMVLLSGGSVRRVGRVIEFAVRGDERTSLPLLRFAAITFGHVIIGVNHAELRRLRAHELVHVRQYETWGVLFFPAYAACSLCAWLNGRCPHGGNRFEIGACAEAERPG